MNTQIEINDGAQSGASLPPRNGSASYDFSDAERRRIVDALGFVPVPVTYQGDIFIEMVKWKQAGRGSTDPETHWCSKDDLSDKKFCDGVALGLKIASQWLDELKYQEDREWHPKAEYERRKRMEAHYTPNCGTQRGRDDDAPPATETQSRPSLK